jgi:hypothetical protein
VVDPGYAAMAPFPFAGTIEKVVFPRATAH